MVEDGMRRRSPETTLTGTNLLEESVHALRRATVGTVLCYYLGTAPFVLAVLFFWSDMSQSGLAEEHLVPGALGLTLFFVWMKVWQSVFAFKLSAQVSNEPAARVSPGAWVRAIASQTFIQATGLVLIPVAAQILLPLAWVYAFYQNATVFGLREPSLSALARRSWKQALIAPMQNHAVLFILGLFGFFVFLNVAVTIFSLPRIVKMLAGVETQFTLSFASSFNTTFLAAATGVTYLCLDPLIKAAYVLRCFYGEARATGEDLRVALRYLGNPARAAIVAILLLIIPVAAAAPAQNAPTTAQAQDLDRSIDEVLNRREYTWRSPRPKPEEKVKEESALSKRIREWLKTVFKSIVDFLEKLFSRRGPRGGPGKFSFTTQGLVYLLIALVVAVVGVLLWMLWRARSNASAALEATPAMPVPDLESEDVTGEELPVDGWMQLALELLERGELRLAMRAFYLSSLAHLAQRNLLSIAKFKSNRDYERELRRRSHALPEVTRTFSENVSVFDRVWYGMHEINTDLLQHFRSNVERIRGS
jgi:hypothetical protein